MVEGFLLEPQIPETTYSSITSQPYDKIGSNKRRGSRNNTSIILGTVPCRFRYRVDEACAGNGINYKCQAIDSEPLGIDAELIIVRSHHNHNRQK